MEKKNNSLVAKAIAKAIELHQGQFRKGDTKIPYIVHPIEVGMIVAQYALREELIAAAILHDTAEDCGYAIEEIKKDFGEEVGVLVGALTEDKSIKGWINRKSENVERLAQYPNAYFIKLADCLSNMRALKAAIEEQGENVWKSFNAPKELKMKYFSGILAGAREDTPKKLVEDYVAAFKDLEYSEAVEKKSIFGFALN